MFEYVYMERKSMGFLFDITIRKFYKVRYYVFKQHRMIRIIVSMILITLH